MHRSGCEIVTASTVAERFRAHLFALQVREYAPYAVVQTQQGTQARAHFPCRETAVILTHFQHPKMGPGL